MAGQLKLAEGLPFAAFVALGSRLAWPEGRQLGRALGLLGQVARRLAQRFDRTRGSRRLGQATRMPLTHSDDAAGHGHLHAEDLVVIGPDGVEQPVLRLLAGETLGELLESALGT